MHSYIRFTPIYLWLIPSLVLDLQHQHAILDVQPAPHGCFGVQTSQKDFIDILNNLHCACSEKSKILVKGKRVFAECKLLYTALQHFTQHSKTKRKKQKEKVKEKNDEETGKSGFRIQKIHLVITKITKNAFPAQEAIQLFLFVPYTIFQCSLKGAIMFLASSTPHALHINHKCLPYISQNLNKYCTRGIHNAHCPTSQVKLSDRWEFLLELVTLALEKVVTN